MNNETRVALNCFISGFYFNFLLFILFFRGAKINVVVK